MIQNRNKLEGKKLEENMQNGEWGQEKTRKVEVGERVKKRKKEMKEKDKG